MIDPTNELAPPPAEHLVICRAEMSGWYVHYDGHVVACFEDAAGLARWIEGTLGSIEDKPPPEALPSILAGELPPQRRSLWSVIRGGRP